MIYYFQKSLFKIDILCLLIIIFSFIILDSVFTKRNNKNLNIKNNKYSNNNAMNKDNKLIDEYFFIIDSNNLEAINSHLYGYIISKNGIITDNYFKMIGHYEEPESFGTYIMIRKIDNNIIINQDYYGGYGLYFFENKNEGYFALSNSFFLLVEYLFGKQNLTLNKDFADNFLVTSLCTFSINETMINEIIPLPSNSLINISIKKKINISYIQNKENTIPLESKEGLKIIDKWYDKWGYILRSLKKKTNNISFDLSGGFDSRLALSILLNSGININEILINSRNDNSHIWDEDFKIASNISSSFGFKLNNIKLDENWTKWSTKDSLFSIFYTKLGFNKNIGSIDFNFFLKPRFSFGGGGGESIRGEPRCKIERLLDRYSYPGRQVKGHQEEYYNASMRLYNRSVEFIKREKTFDNGYEIAKVFKEISINKYHFGKASLNAFLRNIYIISPLLDPELRQIKYEISENSTQDLIAYIYTRFAQKLISFPFQKKRKLSSQSLQKAKNLNKQIPKYKIKLDYNNNFFIDTKRKTPVLESYNNKTNLSYIKEILESPEFKKIFYQVYDENTYDWALKYSKNITKFPYRHLFGLLSVEKIIKYITK